MAGNLALPLRSLDELSGCAEPGAAVQVQLWLTPSGSEALDECRRALVRVRIEREKYLYKQLQCEDKESTPDTKCEVKQLVAGEQHREAIETQKDASPPLLGQESDRERARLHERWRRRGSTDACTAEAGLAHSLADAAPRMHQRWRRRRSLATEEGEKATGVPWPTPSEADDGSATVILDTPQSVVVAWVQSVKLCCEAKRVVQNPNAGRQTLSSLYLQSVIRVDPCQTTFDTGLIHARINAAFLRLSQVRGDMCNSVEAPGDASPMAGEAQLESLRMRERLLQEQLHTMNAREDRARVRHAACTCDSNRGRVLIYTALSMRRDTPNIDGICDLSACRECRPQL